MRSISLLRYASMYGMVLGRRSEGPKRLSLDPSFRYIKFLLVYIIQHAYAELTRALDVSQQTRSLTV